MDVFEKQFENLDIHSAVMQDSMSTVMGSTAQTSEVDNLLEQIADENHMETVVGLADAPTKKLTAEEELEGQYE